MANVYMGTDVEDFIFNEGTTYEEAEISNEELNKYGVIECVDDNLDIACYRIALENEQNFNAINHIIMMEKLSLLESTDASNSKGFKKIINNIKDIIRQFWSKIQGVFKKILDKISFDVNTNKLFIQKYKGKKLKTPANIDFTGYNFNDKNIDMTFDLAESQIKSFYNHVSSATNEYKDLYNNEKIKEMSDKMKDGLRGSLCVGNNKEYITSDEFEKELKISLFGSVEKTKIKLLEFDKLIDELDNADSIKRRVKSTYKKIESLIKSYLQHFEKLEKDAEKSEQYDDVIIFKTISNATNASLSILNTALNINMSAILTKVQQYRAMANYYIKNQPND